METDSQPAGHDVVVALDVADVSRKALDWAAAYARQAGARLRAVHVITVDAQGVEGWGATPSGYSADDPLLRRYREQIQQLFDGSHPEPDWTLDFRTGDAGPEIVDYASGAALLVLGTREHRGIARFVLGSVSHYCLSHAACPMVAVPPGPATVDPRSSELQQTGHSVTRSAP
ncbi:MAG: universal stress protein [Friedmanniella sp.]